MKNISAITTSYKSNHKEICEVRFKVFVDEQNVPEELEIDGLDDDATHILILLDDKAIGTGRILSDGHIGRVAVLKQFRGKGVGKLIMKMLIEWAQENQLKSYGFRLSGMLVDFILILALLVLVKSMKRLALII